MRNLTSYELFLKGKDAFERKEFLIAEKYFLASLHEYSKSKDNYAILLGSLDKLSLYLYPQGHFENKVRALNFFKIFSRVDNNASLGYAMSLINGVFNNSDFKEAIKQLSKASLQDQLFVLAILLNEGKGVEKNEHKAAILLSSPIIKYGKGALAKQAADLYNSIGIEINLSEDELSIEIHKYLNEIFENNTLNLEEYPIDIDSMVLEFFKNPDNIPVIDTLTNEELPSRKEESDHDYQVRHLNRIFDDASLAPVFKINPKYCIGKYLTMTPYISYNDVLNRKCIIRARPVSVILAFDDEEREIIIQYDSIEELVNDGWRL